MIYYLALLQIAFVIDCLYVFAILIAGAEYQYASKLFSGDKVASG